MLNKITGAITARSVRITGYNTIYRRNNIMKTALHKVTGPRKEATNTTSRCKGRAKEVLHPLSGPHLLMALQGQAVAARTVVEDK